MLEDNLVDIPEQQQDLLIAVCAMGYNEHERPCATKRYAEVMSRIANQHK